MNERYEACLVVHALGDTIGFRNGMWEFNYGKSRFCFEDLLEIFYDFIGLGGVNHLDTKGWKVSDDTLLHLATAESYLYNKDDVHNIEKIIYKLIRNFEKEFKDMDGRYPGINTKKTVKMLLDGTKWKTIPYDDNAGGSGASMRTLCIGLIFYGADNRNELIKHSIETSRLTHNCATGYLGGLVSSLFTAFAIENIPIQEWPHKLVKLLESTDIDSYIKSTRGFDTYDRDKHIFIGKWKQYIEDKFEDNTYNLKKPMHNLVRRAKYYHNNFSKTSFIGAGGDDSVIIAYDCLVDAKNNWEKLIVYAMLHIGDTDTTGCIAGGWYGALYGYDDIPKYMINNLEYKKRIMSVGNNIYNEFYIKNM